MGGDGESHGPQAPQGALHLHCDQLGGTVIFFLTLTNVTVNHFFSTRKCPLISGFFLPSGGQDRSVSHSGVYILPT